jgi:hypothetical protein
MSNNRLKEITSFFENLASFPPDEPLPLQDLEDLQVQQMHMPSVLAMPADGGQETLETNPDPTQVAIAFSTSLLWTCTLLANAADLIS